MDQPLVTIESVSKQFGSARNGVLAIRDISLAVRKGEFISLIGTSGCGKTTLLKMIADLLSPSTGRIAIDGRTPGQNRRARACGMVFQSATLMDWRTIAHNIELPLEIMGVGKSAREQRSAELLDLIRLRDFGARYPRELSAGMQQQVAIARALAHPPRVLLMDEPFGALDEMTRERLGYDLLRIWRQLGVTIIFVTHSVSEAVVLSDRVAVLSPRAAHLAEVIEIDLPRPRSPATRELSRFVDLTRQVRSSLRLNGQQ